jgi:tubulin---tyrosine ligase
VIPFPKATFTPYKYYIGKGNNSLLVRNCLKQRFWWSMGDLEEWDEYNFIWTQWKTNKIISKIKTNADAEAATKLSTKESSIGGSGSMLSTDRDSNSSAETLLTTPTKRKRVATAIPTTQQSTNLPPGKKVTSTTSASKTNVLGAKPEEKEKKETSHSVITYNHMENNFHLSNKKALYYNMKIYYESVGQDWCSVLPLTFHIKEGPSDKEF